MSADAGVRVRFWGWSALVALLLALFAFQVLPRLKFDTDILSLLPPAAAADPALTQALDQVGDHIGRNTVFLVDAADFPTALAAAERFAAVLRGSPAFAKVELRLDADWQQRVAALYQPHRDGLLSAHDRALLQAGDGATLLSQARQALYTPAAFLRRSDPGSDPLDLFGDFLASTTPAAGPLDLRDGVLTGTDQGRSYVLLRAELAGNAFSTGEEDAAAGALDAAFAAAQAAGAQVSGSGVIEHAVAASRLARHEVSLFGGVQVACVIGVLLLVFRSPRVLLLSVLALGLGVVAGLSACQWLFGRVHVLTLVFCSNLAGIAIDYSIYYCADQFRRPGQWRAAEALRFVGPAIGMSCLVALMSYALLGVAPFPGLRQMALFCCTGLATAYCCVVAWFPRAVRPAPAAAALRLNAAFARAAALRRRALASPLRPACGVLLLLLIVAGLLRLRVEDDVRVLQPDPPQLAAQERLVHQRLGNLVDSQFYLVRAADEQALLQREEQLTARLDQLQADGRLRAYGAVSRALPSVARQTQDHALLQSQVYQPGGVGESFMHELGFAPAAIAARREQLAGWTPLQPQQWLESPAAQAYRAQWLGAVGQGYASIVTLSGAEESPAVAAAGQGLDGVQYIDRVADITEVLRRFRSIALWIVAASVLASALLLAIPYGARRGLLLMAAPLGAALGTPALLGLLGVHLTFFHVVALHLVLGLSTEYAILLQLPELEGPSSLLSASLAAALALLAFCLLALSTTPFVHAIGLTVALGVALGFACAWLVGTIGPRRTAAIKPAEQDK